MIAFISFLSSTSLEDSLEVSQKAKKEANMDDAITVAPVANMAALTKLLEGHRLALSLEFKFATTPLYVKLECVQVAVRKPQTSPDLPEGTSDSEK